MVTSTHTHTHSDPDPQYNPRDYYQDPEDLTTDQLNELVTELIAVTEDASYTRAQRAKAALVLGLLR